MVEVPRLVQPLVEGVDDDVHQPGIILHALFEQAGERGKHQRAIETLLVHELQA